MDSAPPFISLPDLDGRQAVEYVFAHRSWTDARRAALSALANRQRVVITGPAGAGKSALLRELARTLHEAGVDAVLHGPAEPRRTTMQAGVLLLDEADLLTEGELQEACGGAAACLLAGLPGLCETVERLALAATPVRLGPLGQTESAQFMLGHLRHSGAPVQAMTVEAAEALFHHAAGVPGDLTLLSGLASFAAAIDGAAAIGPAHVAAAASLRHGDDAPARPKAFATASTPVQVPEPAAAHAAPALPADLPPPAPRSAAVAAGWSWRRLAAAAAGGLALAGGLLAVLARNDRPTEPPHLAPIAATPPLRNGPPPPVFAALNLEARGTGRLWRADAAATQPESLVSGLAEVSAPAPPLAEAALRVPPEAAAPPALPNAASVRVVVAYANANPAQARQAAALVARLAGLGVAAEPHAVRAAAVEPGLRYVYFQDAASAEAVGAALGLSSPPFRRPAPAADATQPGTIELGVAAH